MSKFSVREIVEMAIQTERLGLEFYTGMLGRFAHMPDLKELFETLAKMEKHHVEVFSSMLAKLPADAVAPEGWEEAEHFFRAIVESEFFLGRGKALPSMSGMDDPRKAVGFALGFEKETLLYYYGLRSAMSPADSGMLDAIIKEEQSHIVWLAKYRDIQKA